MMTRRSEKEVFSYALRYLGLTNNLIRLETVPLCLLTLIDLSQNKRSPKVHRGAINITNDSNLHRILAIVLAVAFLVLRSTTWDEKE